MLQVSSSTQVEVGAPVVFTGAPPQVTAIERGYYLVQYREPVRPRNHIVTKDRRCACALRADCPAVAAVREYLRLGGERAPDPKPRSIIPACCLICRGAVQFEPRLCSPTRGAGWVCLAAAKREIPHWPTRYWSPGESHYWQYMWAELGKLRFGSK